MPKLNIEITHDEALVLFEFLARFDEKETLAIEHPSEEKVLWRVHAALEKLLVEPFAKDYQQILDSARKALIED